MNATGHGAKTHTNSPRAKNILRLKRSIFIILSGGPGIRKADDPDHHDQSWANFVTAPALMWNAGTLKAKPDEEIHWLIYQPAYETRWVADNGNKTPNDYIETIKTKKDQPSVKFGKSRKEWKLVWLQNDSDFWNYINSATLKISRVYFYGHAGYGLYLDWTYPQIVTHRLTVADVSAHASLKDKFLHTGPERAHKFFGCTTALPADNFAKAWAMTFGVYAEGANAKVQFDRLPTTGGRVYLSALEGMAPSESNWLRYNPKGDSSILFSGSSTIQ